MTSSPKTKLFGMEPTLDDIQRHVRHHANGAQEAFEFLGAMPESQRTPMLQESMSGTEASLLHVVATTGPAHLVAALISWGANPNAKDRDGETPLHWAASRNGSAFIKPLIDGGADIDAKDRFDETPLMKAVSSAAAESMLDLLEAGANREVENAKGVRPVDLIEYQPALTQMYHAWTAMDVIRNVRTSANKKAKQ